MPKREIVSDLEIAACVFGIAKKHFRIMQVPWYHGRMKDFLKCPNCSLTTHAQESERCLSCSTSFPVIGRLQCFMRDSKRMLSRWSFESQLTLRTLEVGIKNLDDELNAKVPERKNLNKFMRQRLIAEKDGLRKQLETFGNVMSPFIAIQANGGDLGNLPLTQSLTAYQDNILRDWAWQTDENDVMLRCMLDMLGVKTRFELVGVLGCGSGRLASDLCHSLFIDHIALLDANPWMLSVATHMLSGTTLELCERPKAPLSVGDSSKVWTCEGRGLPSQTTAHFLLCDLLGIPPFLNSLDLAVTPFFIDIVPEPFPDLVKRINGMLKLGGCWLNGGSLVFRQRLHRHRYGPEEVVHHIEAGGFKLVAWREFDLPYLASPISRHRRVEKVIFWHAEKTKDRDAPVPFSHLPPWFDNWDAPVQQSLPLSRSKVMHAVAANILSLVDGRRSLRQMAAIGAKSLGLTEDETAEAIANILRVTWEKHDILSS